MSDRDDELENAGADFAATMRDCVNWTGYRGGSTAAKLRIAADEAKAAVRDLEDALEPYDNSEDEEEDEGEEEDDGA